jgi:hypothetical protein
MIVEPVSAKEEVDGLRKLLREALTELKYRTMTHPSSSASNILERGVVALKIEARDLR